MARQPFIEFDRVCRSQPPTHVHTLPTRSEEISGQRLWEGSLLLCAYLVEHCSNSSDSSGIKKHPAGARKSKLDLTGKSVLELGAGTGVVSMLAHRLGASPVIMTDGDDK